MRKKKEIITNNALLNTIAPVGLELLRNRIIIGENLACAYGVIKYPEKVDYGWMAKLSSIPSTVFSYTFKPLEDTGEFVEALNKNIIKQNGTARDGSTPLIRQRAEQAAKGGEKLLKDIDTSSEAVGILSILIMPLAQEEEIFTKVQKKTTSSFFIAKCKARLLANMQKNALKQISPFYTTDPVVTKVTGRVVPLSAVKGGFPNTSSGYNDKEGIYFAKDTAGGLIVLDLWKRWEDRTNSNITILGDPGQGKSTAIKHLILSEYMRGTKIIIVDPEREVRQEVA